MKHLLFISGFWIYPTGLLHVSDNGEMHVHNGNRDSIAFCEDYYRGRSDPIRGYYNLNMRAACPFEMSVECSLKLSVNLVSSQKKNF